MFSQILKIIPKLDSSALRAMEQALNSRFVKVAKKFGSGILNALKGGGIIALASSFIDKLLNPLKETQDAIDRLLKQGDDIVTNAKQFGSTAGELFKLQQIGKSTGLDPESLNQLIVKFQGAIAEAKQDPNKQTSVRKYANDTNMVSSFFQFIQELQKLPKQQQVLVQQEVFGEKQILKMADFLQTDFASQLKLIQAKPAAAYTPGLEKLGNLNDLQDALTARRELNDTLTKSKIINQGMITTRNAAEQRSLDQENKRIQSYQALAEISKFSESMAKNLENGYIFLAKELTGTFGFLTSLANNVGELLSTIKAWRDRMDKLFLNSRLFRGIFGGGDK